MIGGLQIVYVALMYFVASGMNFSRAKESIQLVHAGHDGLYNHVLVRRHFL